MDLFIDADSILYKAAFGIEERGEVVGPLENAFHTIKEKLNAMINKLEPIRYYIILSPEGRENNFRYDIFPDYKKNRLKKPKPVHYKECRDYLIGVWKAIVPTERHEADDEVAIRHMEVYNQEKSEDLVLNSCIASIDKDLDNIPGLHFDYDKNILYTVTEHEAILNFYTQLLTGDRADDVPGIRGIGPVKAKKMLEGQVYEKDMFDCVLQQYTAHFPENYSEMLLMYGQVLWIKRYRNDIWEFPK